MSRANFKTWSFFLIVEFDGMTNYINSTTLTHHLEDHSIIEWVKTSKIDFSNNHDSVTKLVGVTVDANSMNRSSVSRVCYLQQTGRLCLLVGSQGSQFEPVMNKSNVDYLY